MIARLYYAVCDGCGNSARGWFVNGRDARAAVKMRGWHRIPRRSPSHPLGSTRGADLCPTCYATREAPRV